MVQSTCTSIASIIYLSIPYHRSHDVLLVQQATVVEMPLNHLFHVYLGITPFKEMPLVQNAKLARLVLIPLRHLNTVLVALTVKRFVLGYILYHMNTPLFKEYVYTR